jgi:arylmalonate decarboxylase
MGARVIGLLVPEAVDSIPAESVLMYPGITFIARGIALRSLSAAGYDEAMERVIPAAEYLAARGAQAIMLIGTSLTFYRGAAFNDELVDRISSAARVPTGTMSGPSSMDCMLSVRGSLLSAPPTLARSMSC